MVKLFGATRGSRWQRWLVGFAGLLAVGYLSVLATARLIYPEILYPAPETDPNAARLGKLLTLRAKDGVAVHALELSGATGAPLVVYFHGNGVVIGDMLWMANEFARRGLGVVLCEFRGYGLSAGPSPSEAGLYADAEAVLDALGARGIGPERITLFGESLGTGVAVEMALRGRGSRLVLVAPYTSIPDVAARLAPLLPVRLLLRERFDTLAKAPRVLARSLVLHGTADEVIPYDLGERVASALPNARLVTVTGGHHNDLFLDQGSRFFDQIADFVRYPER